MLLTKFNGLQLFTFYILGCEYGDHFTWCKKLTSFQCGDDYYKRECCEQCAQYATTSM